MLNVILCRLIYHVCIDKCPFDFVCQGVFDIQKYSKKPFQKPEGSTLQWKVMPAKSQTAFGSSVMFGAEDCALLFQILATPPSCLSSRSRISVPLLDFQMALFLKSQRSALTQVVHYILASS